MEKKRRKGKEGGMEEKARKDSTFKQEKEQSKQPAQTQAQPKPQTKAEPALNEKDKAILNNVEHIIWNPDILKNLKDSKDKQPNGYSRKKPPIK